jgi:two-component system, OmpR family, response regulator
MDMTRHILVVDDDGELLELLETFFTRNGFRVSTAENGVAMMQALNTSCVDLIILDITMPGEDGWSLCRKLRANRAIPIIMLTAHGTEVDRILGLELGADDYVPKPFSTRELLARVRAVLRRSTVPQQGAPAGSGRVYEFAGWRLDANRLQLYSPQGVLVDLRGAEFDLLLALVERSQQVLTRDQLLDQISGRSTDAFDRSIDVHISRLRQRMETDPKEPELIKTVRGEGYVFAAPVMVNRRAW